MHRYRTHTCQQLRPEHVDETVRISGWVHRKRDHGNLLFVDLRDHYGITQCVIDTEGAHFAAVDTVRVESVVTVTGKLVRRSDDTINRKLATGEVEVVIEDFIVLSKADTLPLQVHGDQEYGEEIRLRYRFLDLRREKMHRNMNIFTPCILQLLKNAVENRTSAHTQ